MNITPSSWLKNKPSKKTAKTDGKLSSAADFLHRLFFHPEDSSNMFL
jgi:hypothetical protein